MAVRKGVEDSSEVQPPGASVPVFVSYASQDAAIANSIVEHLESQGHKCWIAINEAKALVLVMSGNAVDSAHVGREVERADRCA
jgi:TIR domain-containing protein